MIALIALAAALPAVFGIQLGEAVTLPECAHARLLAGRLSSDLYEPRQERLCQKIPGVEFTGVADQGGIIFPTAQMPAILAFPNLTTIVIDNKLEAMRGDTLGYNSTAVIMDQLTQKFGVPTRQRSETVRLRLSAYPSVHAWWLREGYRVEYQAIGGNINFGWVRVETDKARTIREAEERAIEAKRTPL